MGGIFHAVNEDEGTNEYEDADDADEDARRTVYERQTGLTGQRRLGPDEEHLPHDGKDRHHQKRTQDGLAAAVVQENYGRMQDFQQDDREEDVAQELDAAENERISGVVPRTRHNRPMIQDSSEMRHLNGIREARIHKNQNGEQKQQECDGDMREVTQQI